MILLASYGDGRLVSGGRYCWPIPDSDVTASRTVIPVALPWRGKAYSRRGTGEFHDQMGDP